ncbi:ferric reductase transmembrane component 4 [Dactylonectria estremocensis]|uniref:Ferric reductase transmembrane component 4 n=1 Tax=Dactylonectria estremocensis TaxID=1079267 RepID=A0A9P9JFC0_9HYPO|nr:ferric reductase transmembrane component 4 [Dactylonectria estremocensis]
MKAKSSFTALALTLLPTWTPAVSAHNPNGRPGHGLIGYGITMYKPPCAYACQSSVPTTLVCDDVDDMDDMDMGGMDMGPSAECLTANPPYLRSLAWCIYSRCPEDTEMFLLEKWWVMNVAGRQVVQPEPNISYQEALSQVKVAPTEVLGEGDVLNRTVAVDDETYLSNYNIDVLFEKIEISHETYGLVLFISGGAIPIFLSLLRLIPFPARLVSTFNAYVIDPPLFGNKHVTPILNLAIVPTRGQALFLGYIVAINIILSAVSLSTISPNSWYPNDSYQLAAYVANRTGVLSFANIALLILYAGRNNVLLWLTDWSHVTFLLVHRWVAWMCTLQACIHSALWLGCYAYDKGVIQVSAERFWYWGIIATLALTVMLPLSVLPIRKAAYEVFLIAHIALAILAVAGSWYHIIFRYTHQWGYETWLYMAMAIWAFDRLTRIGRMAKHGVLRGYVSRIDDDYLRVDIPGVDCTGHVYAYFPSLSWRVWENHPFSVVNATGHSTQLSFTDDGDDASASPKSGITPAAVKEAGSTSSQAASITPDRAAHGISLFIRAHSGITKKLTSSVDLAAGIPIFLESSYGHESNSLLKATHAPSDAYPNTVCIAGGVGITAVLPALRETLSLYTPSGTTKLFWGVRSRALVDSIERLVAGVKKSETSHGMKFWGSIETHISVGERIDLRQILESQIQAGGPGTTVVVCGPASMADEVRCIVTGLGRHGATVRLVEESFMW